MHQIGGGRMDRIATEVSEEVAVLLHQNGLHPRPREQVGEHHAGRTAAGYQTRGLPNLGIRHGGYLTPSVLARRNAAIQLLTAWTSTRFSVPAGTPRYLSIASMCAPCVFTISSTLGDDAARCRAASSRWAIASWSAWMTAKMIAPA